MFSFYILIYASNVISIELPLMHSNKKKFLFKNEIETILHVTKYPDSYYDQIHKKNSKFTSNNINEWPSGHYGLPKSIYGCPKGNWLEGWRYHDSEDNGNSNRHSMEKNLAAEMNNEGIKHEFCISNNSNDIKWPKGKYCIYKAGNMCPDKMISGYVLWDDENNNNNNKRFGALPNGRYDFDTIIEFCCRSDGSSIKSISLPNGKPFILFPYKNDECQNVENMESTLEYIMFDDEDTINGDNEYGAYPYGIDPSRRDHLLYYCFYKNKANILQKSFEFINQNNDKSIIKDINVTFKNEKISSQLKLLKNNKDLLSFLNNRTFNETFSYLSLNNEKTIFLAVFLLLLITIGLFTAAICTKLVIKNNSLRKQNETTTLKKKKNMIKERSIFHSLDNHISNDLVEDHYFLSNQTNDNITNEITLIQNYWKCKLKS